MACLTRPSRFPPFFPSPLKGERGISGPGGTVSGDFGEFRGLGTPSGTDRVSREPDRLPFPFGSLGKDRTGLLRAEEPGRDDRATAAARTQHQPGEAQP